MKLIALAMLIGSAAALCPGACSGHGACVADDRCNCYDNWTGPDCGNRVCPFTEAWADEDAHSYAECGNKGDCDRSSGVCKCYDGYTGKGCARLSCPSECNNRGTCETMLELNSGYTGWDATKIGVCNCDPGYTGPDCAARICKVGNDVLTTDSSTDTFQVQAVEIRGDGAHATGDFVLQYTDWRGEKWQTWVLEVGTTALAVEEALEGLPNHAIPSIKVSKTTDDDSNWIKQWLVTFNSDFTTGSQAPLEVLFAGCNVDGCQPRYAGLAGTLATGMNPTDLSRVAGVSISTPSGSTNEMWECSGRGTCDSEEGTCECVDGYHGESCQMQTIIV